MVPPPEPSSWFVYAFNLEHTHTRSYTFVELVQGNSLSTRTLLVLVRTCERRRRSPFIAVKQNPNFSAKHHFPREWNLVPNTLRVGILAVCHVTAMPVCVRGVIGANKNAARSVL